MSELVTFSRTAAEGVQVLEVRASTRLWKFAHDRLCVTIVRGGGGAWSNRGKSYEIEPSRLMVMQAGDVHSTTAVHGPASFDALFVEPTLLQRWFGQSLRPGRLDDLAPSLQSRAVLSAFQEVLDGTEWRTDSNRVSDTLVAALGSMFEGQESPCVKLEGACDARVTRARDAIADRYHDEPYSPVDIDAVASQVGVDYFWLVRRFSQHFQVTPYQYAKTLRLARARHLVLQGSTSELQTLAAIAYRAGYCNYAHMARDFKSELGLKPTDLAAQVGGWRRSAQRK